MDEKWMELDAITVGANSGTLDEGNYLDAKNGLKSSMDGLV